MAHSTKKSRVKVKDLPSAKKKLTSKDMKKVKGGIGSDAYKTSLKIEGIPGETKFPSYK